MKRSGKSVGLIFVIGMVAFAVLEYGGAAATVLKPQALSSATAGAAKKETKAQKLKKCKKLKTKSKRKACEKKVNKPGGGGKTTTGTDTGTTKTTTGTTATGTTGVATATTGTTTATTGTTTATTATTTTGTTANTAHELELARAASEMPGASEVLSGKSIYSTKCAVCHANGGEGASGDNYAAYEGLPRAANVTGVIEQLIEPLLGMPNVGEDMKYEEKEAVADFICVELVHKCEQAH